MKYSYILLIFFAVTPDTKYFRLVPPLVSGGNCLEPCVHKGSRMNWDPFNGTSYSNGKSFLSAQGTADGTPPATACATA